MKRLFMLSASILGLCLLLAADCQAHVFITDSSSRTGAVLHITPDDNPIAGRKASLFFDTQGKLLDKSSQVKLSIAQESKDTYQVVETRIDGSLVTADYIFPSQGVYHLRYVVEHPDGDYLFEQTTRISRGVSLQAVDKSTHTWAEGLLVICLVAAMILLILAWNRRQYIARQSSF